MNEQQKYEICKLRNEGLGYTKIAKEVRISVNTVKSFFHRNRNKEPMIKNKDIVGYCENCGKAVIQVKGRKKKRFCSDKCRNEWWNNHKDMVNHRAIYDFTCKYCGKKFSAYGNSNRKFCSHSCYIKDRFGGDAYE